MKEILAILLLMTLVTNEIVIDLFHADEERMCIIDSPSESEKEAEDHSKEKNKVQVSTSPLSFLEQSIYIRNAFVLPTACPHPYLEIFSPPPEPITV